jgi:hypothetical protein
VSGHQKYHKSFEPAKSVFLMFYVFWIKHCVTNQWRDTVLGTALINKNLNFSITTSWMISGLVLTSRADVAAGMAK